MSLRVRMTMVYEFDYLAPKLGSQQVHNLAENFLDHPTEFLHPKELEVDEVLMFSFEDITGE
jgi:hypothetical protein